MITLTDSAASKVKQLLEAEGAAELALRVAVRPGGCSGFAYEMFFDGDIATDDEKALFGAEGQLVQVVVDPASAQLLVGATLASAHIGHELKGALGLALLKNLLLPALVALVGMAMGLHGLPLTVMVVTASLPIGANVFMFSQRYNVAEELVTAGVAVSAVLAMLSVSLVMALVQYL